MERYLKIYSDALLNKVIDFIYIYCGLGRVNLFRLHLWTEEYTEEISEEINKLRGVFKKSEVKDETKLDEVDYRIDLFLKYMCETCEEASLNIESLLDEIIGLGEQSFKLQNIDRLVGTLAATVLIYYCPDKYQDKRFSDDMKSIYTTKLDWYTPKDTEYLITIFLKHNEYDCLISLLERVEKNQFADVFIGICLHMSHNEKRAKDIEFFIKRCEKIFDEYRINKNIWYFELANNLFVQRKYEESKKIWESLKVNGNDLSMLYNRAITYAWAANEKKDKEYRYNVKKAMEDIQKGIELLSEYDEDEDEKIKKHRVNFYLEKSFLLTEQEKENTEENTERDKYNEAYNWLKQAYSIAKNTDLEWFKRSSNYNTHLWIISQYLKNLDEQSKPDEQNQSKSDEFNSTLQKNTILNSVIKLDSDEFSYFPAEYRTIFEFVRNDEYLKKHIGEQVVVCKHLLFTLLCAQEIKHASKIRDVSQYDLVYYTKLSNLKLLLEDEEKDQVHFRTPLFHAYHMNDPQEGKILDIYLRAEAEEKAEARFTYEENYVFLKSYFSYPKKENGESQLKEFLPMWVQYGDEAQGCCVVLNAKTFEGCDLRRISYLDDDGNCVNDVTNQMNEILKDFEACYKQTKKESNTIMEQAANLKDEITKAEAYECVSRINQMLKYIVSLVSYLFKHESYKHENEVRLIKTLTPNDLDQIRKIPGNVPKTYIYNDTQTYIDEIILGSKVSNPEDFVPFLCIQGRKMWDGESKEQITISHSAIQYR